MLNTKVMQNLFLELTDDKPWAALANITLSKIHDLILFQNPHQWKCSVQPGVKQI